MRLTPLLLPLCLLFPVAAFADWTKLPSNEFTMDDYPKEGSAEYRADFETLKRFQESRSKESCSIGRRQEHPTYEAMYMSKDSPLTDEEAEKAHVLVAKVMKLSDKVAKYFKGKFLRPRPYDTDTSLEPCVKKPGGEKSYPSSHSANSAAGACVLAQIFPGKKQEILDYGDANGELRAIVGVHHPSDVAAGQKLGRELCARLAEEPDFERELRRLK